jgi:hypothetical protein
MRLVAALVAVAFGCGQGSSVRSNSGSSSAGSGGHAGGAATTSTAATSSSSTGGAGGAPNDGGPTDAAPADANPDAGPDGDAGDAAPPNVSAPGIPCTDTLANVYVTPSNLQPPTLATRGDVLRCAFDVTYTEAQVAQQAMAKGVTTPMKTGVSLYRIEFRTQRGDGSDGASSARVYLPATPAALPLPVIVVGHPSDGLAQSCAPSLDPNSNQDLALPWAGLGFAVIVPDYAGLGNGGVQAYLDNHDQAYSILDGARAIRKLLPVGAFSPSVLTVGWSQGGGAVLSAQALAKSYGCDGTLAGVVAFAPQWPTRMNSFGFVNLLNNPTELTILTGISENVILVLREYAYFANRVGPTHADDGFPVSARSGIDNAVKSLCLTPLGGYLQATAPHVGDMFDPTFLSTMLACIGNAADAGAPDAGPGCADPGLSYYQFLQQNFVTADPAGPPMLYVQGLADIIMPPASEAACNLQKLAKDGVVPQLCVDPQAQHTDVVGRNMDFVIAWTEALLAGKPLPATCPSTGLPACTP